MVDNSVPVIRRGIEGVELQTTTASIDDIVFHSGRDDHREARSDLRSDAVENGLADPLLDAKELVEIVYLGPNLFLGLQRHHYELAVLRRVEDPAKLGVLEGELLDVLHETFH